MSETDAPERAAPTAMVLITGLSGSGKSTVARCFEDLGYFTVDNLPLPLLRQLARDPSGVVGKEEPAPRVAVVTDVRAPGFAQELPKVLAEIDRDRVQATLLFLESSDEALVRRFSETRRPHPLALGGSAIEGIRRERELLAELRARADLVLDTSEWSIHEIRGHVFREFGAGTGNDSGPVINLVSFGFKFGIPYGSDLLFDVRFLPNPHFVAGLREQTGRDPAVRRFLEETPDFVELGERLENLLLYLLPRYKAERRSYLSVAVGCTGGKHRSVGLCERLAEGLQGQGWNARVVHRDIQRS